MRRPALLVSLWCVSCATAPALDFTQTREPPRPVRPRSADQVEVFMSAAPEQAHVEVGVVEAQQQPGSKDQAPELIAKMQALAGQHGCDALANFTSNDTVIEDMLVPGGATRKYTLSGYRASCIVYLMPPAPKVQAPPAQVAAPVSVP